MLNLFKLKNSLNNSNITSLDTENKPNKYFKNYSSPVREWNNSIYVYNKYVINVIPVTVNLTLKIIKSYFNLYNKKLEKKIRRNRLIRRFKRLSSHKIYISNGEFKHTNNKVLITIYLFNRQEQNYKLKIKKSYLRLFKKYKERIQKKLYSIKFMSVNSLKQSKKKKYIIVSQFYETQPINLVNKDLNYLTSILLHKKYNAMDEYYRKIAKKSLKKIKMYFFYKQLLYINNSKLNYTYLQTLKVNLEKLYNKNVEFNLVNLKYFYLNSYILFESLILKIKKNRKILLKLLNKLITKVKIHNITDILYLNERILDNKKSLHLGQEKLNLDNITNNKISWKKTVKRKEKKELLNNIKHKYVTGVRIQATGRLTRRYTASRSACKLKYKGNLINIESSVKRISSIILRNNLKTNIQYTKLNSKTRIGSFGLKGWVSSN